jgi:hypothetical protein
MSTLDARVRLRDGMRDMLADGGTLSDISTVPRRNLLLDSCGSDHRPLVDLLVLIARHIGEVSRTPLDEPTWTVQRERLVNRMAEQVFIEPDAARWAIETIFYAHGGITEEQLEAVRPFESLALSYAQPVRRPRRVVTAAVATVSRPVHHSPLSHIGVGQPMAMTPRATASTLRFGQPWYAVQNGNALVALPSPSRGPRRPPPIAPISNVRFFAGWTRQTLAVGGALGAITLTIAFSYWLMLNAARGDAQLRISPPRTSAPLVDRSAPSP